jgi:hypothetical protein
MQATVNNCEIVRLPVASGRLGDLLALLKGHPYFAQPELRSWRVLTATDESEVALVIDWNSPGAAVRALKSPAGTKLTEGLQTLLSGKPVTAHYRAEMP